MLNLEEMLLGVQPEETRRQPALPAALRQLGFSEVVIDSREVVPGSLFVALPGERVDGHAFLADAAARGARAALVQRSQAAGIALDRPTALIDPGADLPAEADSAAMLLIAVEDTLAALQRLAAYYRGLFAPKVIGITGSVGKTSTKEVVAAVLGRRYRTLKNPRSYNNEATLPISLLQLTAADEVAVLEMGTFGPGEITLLTQIARPDIGIVTNVGPSHLERMGSLDAIARAKSELVQALPEDGYAILNADDQRVRAMAEVTRARSFLYGLDPSADLWADEIESRGLEGISFRAHHAGESVALKLPLLGRHSVHTALAAASAGLLLGLGWDAIIAGLRDRRAQLRLLAVPGFGGATLIDDTYNASPASSLAALNLLAELEGRRIVALGDMLELGDYEQEGHRLVGRRVAQVADLLIVIGRRAAWIAEEAASAGMPRERILRAASNDEVIALLRERMQPGDYVLVKGSRGAAMEGIVAALQRQPERA